MSSTLQHAIAQHTALGEEVCAYIQHLAAGFGLPLAPAPNWQATHFEQKVDPYSQEVSLLGTWQDGSRYGTATFFPDGRVFAEYQLLIPHPQYPDKFVESVSVWGHGGALKQAVNLLDVPQ